MSRCTLTLVFALLLLAGALPLVAGEPYLVKDIYPGLDEPSGSHPYLYGSAGSRVVFQAHVVNVGWLPWGSDGTAAGTEPLLDPCASFCEVGMQPFGQTDRLAFFHIPGDGAHEGLWSTNGTQAGTFRLAGPPVRPQSGPGSAPGFVSTPSQIYFLADDSVHGTELWRSDGTPNRTYLVTDLRPGSQGAAITELTVLGERAVFVADDGLHGAELWVTDGSREGARLLRDLCPGPCSSAASLKEARLGTLGFFTGTDGVHGRELWATDGSDAGTRLVGDLCAGSCNSSIPFVGVVGDQIGFILTLGSTELWSWSPSAPVATRRAFFNPTDPARLPFVARVVGRRLFLGTSEQRGVGAELWRSNLAPGGTVLVRDIDPSGYGIDSFPHGYMKLGSESLFFARAADRDHWLWKTNGTEAGTVPIPLPDSYSQKSTNLWTELGSLVLFGLRDEGRALSALWRSDGTPSGTFSLGPPNGRFYASEESPVVAGGLAFFTAEGDGTGFELWATDGTVAGTRLVDDLEPGSGSSIPRRLTALGSRIVFSARTALDGDELWVSDGTPAGTRLVKDLTPGIDESTNPRRFVRHGSKVYFATRGSLDGRIVWRTDGTAAGTEPALDGSVLPEVSSLTPFASTGAQLFLYGGDALYASDGESGSLRKLVSFGRDAGIPLGLAVGGRLYFFLTSSSSSLLQRLWTSDGTSAGTVPVERNPGTFFNDIDWLQVVGGHLYFKDSVGFYTELWTTDGTAGGLRRLIAGNAPTADGLSEAGGKLVFTRNWFNSGYELWALEP